MVAVKAEALDNYIIQLIVVVIKDTITMKVGETMAVADMAGEQ